MTVAGEARELTTLPEKLGFDNVVLQRLPHYGSNITYYLPVKTSGGALELTVPHFDGTAVKVALDGSDIGYIAYPPYRLPLGKPEAGAHTVALTLLGNRENCFGPLHLADSAQRWIGPNAWRSVDAEWTDSYRLKSLGIRTAPILTETES